MLYEISDQVKNNILVFLDKVTDKKSLMSQKEYIKNK